MLARMMNSKEHEGKLHLASSSTTDSEDKLLMSSAKGHFLDLWFPWWNQVFLMELGCFMQWGPEEKDVSPLSKWRLEQAFFINFYSAEVFRFHQEEFLLSMGPRARVKTLNFKFVNGYSEVEYHLMAQLLEAQ